MPKRAPAKLLWEDIKPPEDLFEAAKAVAANLEALPPDPAVNAAIGLIQLLAERVASQNAQMLRLTQELYRTMDDEKLIRLLYACGVSRSELVSCWGVEPEDAETVEKVVAKGR